MTFTPPTTCDGVTSTCPTPVPMNCPMAMCDPILLTCL
jgi:hypothetical protein